VNRVGESYLGMKAIQDAHSSYFGKTKIFRSILAGQHLLSDVNPNE